MEQYQAIFGKASERKNNGGLKMSEIKQWESYPLMLSVDQVSEILQLGKWTTYGLVHRNDFPAVRIGQHKIRVNRDELKSWIARQRGSVNGDS